MSFSRNNSLQFGQDFYYNSVFLLLIILLYILTFFPLIGTGFTTNDDTLISLQSFEDMLSSAKLAGRVGFIFNGIIGYIPYASQSELYYQFFRLGSQALLLFCLFFFLRKFFCSSIPSLIVVTFFLAFIQNNWEHNLTTSYPFIFSILFCLFLLSAVFFIRYLETSAIFYGLVSAFLYFLSLSYEIFVLYFFVFIFLSLCYKKDNNQRFFGFIKNLLPISIAVFVYLVIYFSFRYFNPQKYSGNYAKVDDWSATIEVIWQYSISSLPGYDFSLYFFKGQNVSSKYLSLVIQPVSYFFDNFYKIKVEWIIKSIIIFYIVFFVLFGSKKYFSKKKLIISSFIAFIYIFIPNILIGFTEKYQKWVMTAGSHAYLSTYYSFIAQICFLSFTLILACDFLSNLKKIRFLLITFISISAATVSFLTDFHNFYVTQDQMLSQSKWRTINHFLSTPEYQSIKNGSLVYAPSLFKNRGIVANHSSYWSDYFMKKTGKIVNVIKEIPEKLPSENSIYFLKYEEELNTDNQYLVFVPISKTDDWYRTKLVEESSMTIFSNSRNNLLTIIGFLPSNEDSNVKVFINDIMVKNKIKSAFIQTVNLTKSTSDFIPIELRSEKALLNPENISISYYTSLPELEQFRISLGNGFYIWEYNGNDRWVWTNGNAQLDIYNPTKQSMRVILRFSIGTLKLPGLVSLYISDELIDSYKLELGKSKDVEVNTILKQGHNRVFFETNIPAELPGDGKGDSRKISFRLINNIDIEKILDRDQCGLKLIEDQRVIYRAERTTTDAPNKIEIKD